MMRCQWRSLVDTTLYVVKHRFDFLDWFEEILLSGELNVVKPDPAIYRILLERINREAQECVLFDDSIANVQAAMRLGFQAIHFESPDQLRSDLNQMSIFEPRESLMGMASTILVRIRFEG